MVTANNANGEQSMSMVRSVRNNNIVHHLLPAGFESCPPTHALCPACNSTLTLKAPTTKPPNNTNNKKNKRAAGAAATAAALIEADADAQQAMVRKNLASSLESARAANSLLQALSFDAATREEKRGLEPAQLAEGVSYCPDCKVHVATSAEELERLFDEYDESDDEDGCAMEWLRGSLLVLVDDDEVVASKSGRQATPHQVVSNSTSSLQPAISQPSSSQQQQAPPQPQMSLLTQPDEMSMTTAAPQQGSHNQPKPTRPIEFTYDYRHKVATHAMAHRIGQGYTMLEEMCSQCEMPLMMKTKERKHKECVVCRKLLEKIAGHQQQKNAMQQGDGNAVHRARSPPRDASEEIMETMQQQPDVIADPNYDPISAIIAEARMEAPRYQCNRTRTELVEPSIAEAKRYIMQRRILAGDDPIARAQSYSALKAASAAGGTIVADNSNPIIDWEELLVNGRSILSKRLNEGWNLSSGNCTGANCKATPLLTWLTRCRDDYDVEHRTYDDDDDDNDNNNVDYCAVCGGSGNGKDGAYERELEHTIIKAARLVAVSEREALRRSSKPDRGELAGSNGRALLAERLKRGLWTMSSDNCLGRHCNSIPLLTNSRSGGGGPNSCVVCGGSGSGCDGAYESYNRREAVEEERALVSQELSRLLSMGWVLRESLCLRCLMPMVAEDVDAEDNLCVLCGHLAGNNPHLDLDDNDDSNYYYYGTTRTGREESYEDDTTCVHEYVLANEEYAVENHGGCVNGRKEVVYQESENESYLEDHNIIKEVLLEYSEAVYDPVVTYGDDNTDEAGRKLLAGWTLPDAGLCHHCQGVQMTPPSSTEVGCINRGCPSALAAAYTSLPEPSESTGPVMLIGRGFSDRNKDTDEAVMTEMIVEEKMERMDEDRFLDQVQDDTLRYCDDRCEHHEQYEYEHKQYLDQNACNFDYRHLPKANGHQPPTQTSTRSNSYDEPSFLSDDLSQVRSANSMLSVIIVQLYDIKYELEAMQGGDPRECAEQQVEIAMLIEKLASAAVRLEQKEGLER